MTSVSYFKFFKCILITIVVSIFISVCLIVAISKVSYPVCYIDYVKQYSKEYGLETELVLGIINTESGFDRFAVSRKGAIGLMQIIPSTAEFVASKIGIEDFNKTMLYDARVNIQIGCAYLFYLYTRFKETEHVLFAYNAGEGNLKEFLIHNNGNFNVQDIEITETKNYIRKVRKAYNHYNKWHNL